MLPLRPESDIRPPHLHPLDFLKHKPHPTRNVSTAGLGNVQSQEKSCSLKPCIEDDHLIIQKRGAHGRVNSSLRHDSSWSPESSFQSSGATASVSTGQYSQSINAPLRRVFSPKILGKLHSLSHDISLPLRLFSKDRSREASCSLSGSTPDPMILSTDHVISSRLASFESSINNECPPCRHSQLACVPVNLGQRYDCVLPPCLLAPNVTITPETSTLSNGEQSLWAAIEIKANFNCPRIHGAANLSVDSSLGSNDSDSSRYEDPALQLDGNLYDMQLDIRPLSGCKLLRLIGRAGSKTMSRHGENVADTRLLYSRLDSGSRILVLAQIQLPRRVPSLDDGPTSRSTIMEDLQFDLGVLLVKYVDVRLSYHHSEFPSIRSRSGTNGFQTQQTKLETSAIGIVRQRNRYSIWSSESTTTENHLAPILVSHWGFTRASEFMQEIKITPAGQLKLGEIKTKNYSNESVPGVPQTSLPPAIPQRRTSLQRDLTLAAEADPAQSI